VLAEFPTLREAVRAAGLEPNPKGEKISTDDLIQDWKRIGEKLGRRPSRAEYVREGKYSAGAFVARFGSWGNIHHGGTETRRKSKTGSRESTRKARITKNKENGLRQSCSDLAAPPQNFDKAIAMRWATQLAQVPGPVAGKRRVTEAVAQLVVNTLLAPGNWHLAISQNQNPFATEVTEERGEQRIERANEIADRQVGMRSGRNNFPPLRSSVVKKDKPVMGEPFDRSPLTNAPMNELGVVLLFGMVAADMGFQVESLQGKFPDCEAKREVSPGKWQRCRIEFEYESKNFHLHGHDPKGCDVIVCWRHNWRECPAELEVIELCRIFGQG
jgi:hypothetical protein